MTAETLVNSIEPSNFIEQISSALNEWPDAESLQSEISEAIEWVSDISRSIQDVFNQLAEADESELRTQAAIAYIELKSRWIALNTKINYQMFKSGSCSPIDAFRGSAISILLATIEEQIDSSDIEQITEFLSEPVKNQS